MRGVDRLCFGTSTFVAGRLCPYKDSSPGMRALRVALTVGVRLIHSNPNLGTQWAVRKVIDSLDNQFEIGHLIKAEAVLTRGDTAVATAVASALDRSCEHLSVDHVRAVVVEIDLKRTADDRLLHDVEAVRAFYAAAAEHALADRRVDFVYAYCHGPAHLRAALAVPGVTGVASQFHQRERWAEKELRTIADTGKVFIGMSPLARGQLVNTDLRTPAGRLRSLCWALARPEVSAVAITMSSVAHFAEVVQVAEAVNRSAPCPA